MVEGGGGGRGRGQVHTSPPTISRRNGVPSKARNPAGLKDDRPWRSWGKPNHDPQPQHVATTTQVPSGGSAEGSTHTSPTVPQPVSCCKKDQKVSSGKGGDRPVGPKGGRGWVCGCVARASASEAALVFAHQTAHAPIPSLPHPPSFPLSPIPPFENTTLSLLPSSSPAPTPSSTAQAVGTRTCSGSLSSNAALASGRGTLPIHRGGNTWL